MLALLEAGADPNASISFDQTALHYAAYGGHAGVVGVLLEHGARHDVRERQFERTAGEWARETGEDALARVIESS